MSPSPAISVSHVTHHYGERRALNDLSLEIESSEIFALLGPNGGGKTTLFRLLSTLIPLQEGTIAVLGDDVAARAGAVRQRLGVVFQAPSLDKKLTVGENLLHQGRLYGLSGHHLRDRSADMLAALGLADRAADRIETLSGGLRRRVELAKGLLHSPRVLVLDEPSTGLDPGARSDLWGYLRQVREAHGATIVLTTHLLEEADKADRIAILHEGALVAEGTPDALRASVGGDTLTIVADDAAELAAEIRDRLDLPIRLIEDSLRIERPDAHQWAPRLFEAFPGRIRSITLGQPSLEDVFIARTGHRFWRTAAPVEEASVG